MNMTHDWFTDPTPYGNDARYIHPQSRRPMGGASERGNSNSQPSFSRHASPPTYYATCRMANTVGPSRTVACAPPAFRQGRVRVLIYDSGNDSKIRSKSFLLFPLHRHRTLSLPSSEILTGHYSPANGGPIDSTRNALAMRVIVSDFYTTLILFSPQATPRHQTSKRRTYPRRLSRLYRSAPSDGRASTLTQGR